MSALRVSRRGFPTQLLLDPDAYTKLTPRQRQILEVVRSHNGNRSRAARELGVTIPCVQAALRLCAQAGVTLPPIARRGPDLHERTHTA